MHHFTDRAGRGLTLPVNGGVFLGDGLRTTLPVRVGDAVTVTVPATGLQVTEPVAAFLDEPMAAVAYLERTPRNPCPHPRKHRRAPRLATGVDPHTVGHRLTSLPGAAIYIDNAVTESTMRKSSAIMDTLVALMPSP